MFRKSKEPSAEEKMALLLTQAQGASPTKEHSSDLEIKFAALWQLLQEKLGLSDQDLEAMITKIKDEETSQDAQKSEALASPGTLQKCPKCGRTVSAKSGVCIYCGKDE